MEAWQQEVPFTVRELEALLPALKNALMTLLCDLAGQCADEQHILAAADETVAQLENQQEKKAAKLFEQHRHHRLYLSRLTACVRKAPEGDAALWMRQLPLIFSESDEQLTEEERLHQSEAVRWVSNAISSLQQLDHLPPVNAQMSNIFLLRQMKLWHSWKTSRKKRLPNSLNSTGTTGCICPGSLPAFAKRRKGMLPFGCGNCR